MIYAVPGNNDIHQLIEQYLPFAQIIEPDTRLTIAGVSCTLGHAWYEATKESRWSFYGHGLTGETWRPELTPKERDAAYRYIPSHSVVPRWNSTRKSRICS